MIWITADDIKALHSHVIEKSGNLNGLKDRDILELAIATPHQFFSRNKPFSTNYPRENRLLKIFAYCTNLQYIEFVLII